MNRFRYFSILVLLFVGFNCKKNNNNNANTDFFNPVLVDFYINLDLPGSAPLRLPQGAIYQNGGNKGIVVYNTGFSGSDQYVAFDRTCPYKPDSSCSVVVIDPVGLFYNCGSYVGSTLKPCCGSMFAAQNGGQVQGPASRGLRQYFVTLAGNQLHVTSSPQ